MSIVVNASTRVTAQGLLVRRRCWLGLAGAAALLAAPAAAQDLSSGLPPRPPETIVAAAQSCANAVTTDRLDEERLAAEGWVLGQISDRGRSVDTSLRFFSRDSLLLMTDTSGGASCVIMARLESVRNFAPLREGLIAVFGQPSEGAAEASTMWVLPGNRAAQLDTTGSRNRPGVRIIVIHMSGNSP